jgi:hypothetical protein
MSINRCRSHARGDSVSMPREHVDLVVQTSLEFQLHQLGEVPRQEGFIK